MTRLQLKLFDYAASNDGTIQLVLDNHVVEVKSFKLKGADTALALSGDINLHANQIALDASGDADLAILQAFYYQTIRSSGSASLHAQVRGPLDSPVFSGDATITGGRVRYFSLPHSLQDFNGRLAFDAQGIRIVDTAATLGGGAVIRWADRVERVRGGRHRSDRQWRADAPALSRGFSLERRRPAHAARQHQGTGARWHRHDQRRRVRETLRAEPRHLLAGVRRRRGSRRARRKRRRFRSATT